MYLFTLVAFAALPFLVGAVSVSQKSSRTDRPISIPLSRRSDLFDDHNGFVDPEKLQASLSHTMARFDHALDAYERNTGKPHPLALKRGHSNERRIFVPVPLNPNVQVVWTGDISVGTPARAYSVSFDTLTADIYLSGLSCPSCRGQNFYDISLSSTGKNLSLNVEADFGFGIAKGSFVNDSVFVGGNVVYNQRIIVATSIDPFFQFPNFAEDGVLGWGFKETSIAGADSYFTSLVNFGGPSNGDPVFGFRMTPSQTGAELVIGGRDTSKFSGNLTYIKLSTPPGFWQIALDSITFNGTAVVTAQQAILDTGNPFVAGNNETIANIYRNIPRSTHVSGTGLWLIPCDTDVTLNITLVFSGIGFTIPPTVAVDAGPGNLCLGTFASLNVPSPIMHVGTAFMRTVYTEFDQGNSRVGFAPNV